MKAKPSVSIVMPVFNGEAFLREAVDSILTQSFNDFEFIIVNDGSFDRTSAILHSYKDSRIILMERENQGIAASLNEGVSRSSGKYIARMDADDISVINRLQLQFEFMEKHQEVGILGGQVTLIDEQGCDIGKMTNPTTFEHISQLIKIACPVFHPTYFLRALVYTCMQGYRVMPVEDYDFLLRAYEKGVIINNLSEIVLKYRIRKNSVDHSNLQRTIFWSTCVKKMYRLRMKGKNSDNQILRFMHARKKRTSAWFSIVMGIKEYLNKIARSAPSMKPLSFTLKMLVSLLHYQVLLLVLEGIRTTRIGKECSNYSHSEKSSTLSIPDAKQKNC